MSLFKIFKGPEGDLKNLSKTTEGYAYYTTDKSHMYVDVKTGTIAPNSEDSAEDGTQLRQKVIGLSQVSKNFDLDFRIWHSLEKISDFFKEEGYTYIVSPLSESFDKYAEAGIRATSVKEGSMTFICKENTEEIIKVSILRIEEDPYAKV